MQVTTFRRIIIVWPRRVLTLALAGVLVLALTPRSPIAGQQPPQETTPAASETPEQLQQLVAPIALYPDALVAQILAASTYPTEVVQADRWLQQNPNLQGEQLAGAVDKQPWDPSVKALTGFPSVLVNLDKNLSWTEALGDAYFNQQQGVLDAVQVMRGRAADAGNLQSTPQERVVNQGQTIVIEPAQPDVCYVPTYDPWIVYGSPLAAYPGYFYDGWFGPPFISFGPAIGLGFFGGFGWGWPFWGFNWGRRVVVFNHNPYVSRSRYFFHQGLLTGARGIGGPRRGLPSVRGNHGFNNRSGVAPNARFGNGWANHSPVAPRSNTGPRSGVFNSAGPGGIARDPLSREGSSGRSGLSGGDNFRGGSPGGRSFGGGSPGGRSFGGGGWRAGGGGSSRGGGGGGQHR
jgi:uncharacterized membrane protein YgcG